MMVDQMKDQKDVTSIYRWSPNRNGTAWIAGLALADVTGFLDWKTKEKIKVQII